MKSGTKLLIGFIVVVLLLTGYTVYRNIASRVILNDGNVSGNYSGNLWGSGYFCQYGDKVYFSNPSDNGALYVMDVDESNPKKLIGDKVYFINTDGNYIYYCRDSYAQESAMSFLKVNQNCLCRCKMDGSDVTILDENLSTNAVLCGNTIYYNRYDTSTGTVLYSIGIDKSNPALIERSTADPRCVYNGVAYYAGVLSDHYLHKIDGSRTVVAAPVNVWQPILTNSNTVYSLDLDNDYRVCRMDTSNGSKVQVTPFKATSFNVHGTYVIYQSYNEETDGIYIYDMASQTNTLVMPGQYKDINVTDRYFYFRDYQTDAMYHSGYAGIAGSFAPGL